jgi:hypothetical protein
MSLPLIRLIAIVILLGISSSRSYLPRPYGRATIPRLRREYTSGKSRLFDGLKLKQDTYLPIR